MKKPRQESRNDSSPFLNAATKGDASRVKALLQGGQKVCARDDVGKTALMRAAERGHSHVVKILLDAGANADETVSDRDSIWFGCNALMFAAQSGDESTAKLLVDAGASPDCKASDETTPLSHAIERCSTGMVEALLNAGAPATSSNLVSSIWNGSEDITLLLIKTGVNVNVSNDLGQPVIHRVAETGQHQVLQGLIQRKAKLNQKTFGNTPLLIAIQKKRATCAITLIQSGADISALSEVGMSPLMCAAELGQEEVVAALLKAGANVKVKDNKGRTALMLANERGHTEVVRLLSGEGHKDKGFKIQEIIQAAMSGNARRIEALINEGVDVNATYLNGAKPLVNAAMHGHAEVVRVLIRHGVDVNALVMGDMFGLKVKGDALTVAAEKGHLEIVRLLIKAGADVNQSRKFHVDALTLAAGRGHTEIVTELIRAGFSVRSNCALDALKTAVSRKRTDAAVAIIKSGVKLRGKSAANILVDAVERGLTPVVKVMVKAGVDPKIRDENDDSAVQAATVAGHKEIAALLNSAKSPQANPNLSLIEAAEIGDLKTVHRLILEGADIEARDAMGVTALIRAASNSHLPVMKALLKAGASPNAATPVVKRDKKKWFSHMDLTSDSPLSAAVSAGCISAIQLLLEAGTEIRKSECGHLACMILQGGKKEGSAIVGMLVDAGLDPNSTWPVVNASLLHQAAQQGFADLVEKLISKGARLRTARDRDLTIVDAIERGRLTIARILIQRGIAPDLKGHISSEALVVAARDGHDDIVQLLLKHGIKIDAKSDSSFDGKGPVESVTPLMGAACHGREKTVKLLLTSGANPLAEDPIGRTALDWAKDFKNEEVVQRICRLIEFFAK